jgi:glycosyltransferase involved in cell wall biosynthesis
MQRERRALEMELVTSNIDLSESEIGRSTGREPGTVLLVGNFVPASSSYGSVGQELACRLESAGWRAIRTSYHQRKAVKLMDMVHTCWSERNRFDVAHVELYSGKAFIWAEAVCTILRRLSKPYILGLHGGNLPDFLSQRTARARSVLLPAFAVVSPSHYLKEALSVYRSDVQLIPNALDLQSYPGRPRCNPKPEIVWLRAFRKMYAPEIAVEAFASFAQDFADARLTMIGPDRHDGSLERTVSLARHLGVFDRITFITGVPKSEVAAYLNKADIFLNTSTIDNTPVSVVEALACGLCVVSTNVGGIGHLLRNEFDSLLVQPGQSTAIGNAVRRVLTEDGLAAKLSKNALQKVKDFDWKIVLPRWYGLLASAQLNRTPYLEERRSHASVD